MKQELYVASDSEIAKLVFDSSEVSLKKLFSVDTDEKPTYMLLSGNILFVSFAFKISSYLTSDTVFTEISSVYCEDFTPCHLEFVSSSSCLIAAGGEGGKNAVYSVVDGRILPSPHIFTHSFTDNSGVVHQGGFASCNKATNNPYRIASLDKKNGTAIIANLLNNGMSVRECSRINVGKEKGISDIVFTDTDIAYILCENSGELILTDFHSGSGSLWPLKIFQFASGLSNPQICISKNNRRLFCLDRKESVLSVFNLSDFSIKDVHKFPLNEPDIHSLCVSNDGQTVFLSYADKVNVYVIENEILKKSCNFTTSEINFITL